MACLLSFWHVAISRSVHCAPSISNLSASIVIQFSINFEQRQDNITELWTQRQIKSKWALGPFLPIFIGKIPKTFNHLNTSAKATCTGARDPCFTVVKRSSNVIAVRETLTSARGRPLQRPSNVSETLARQRCFSGPDVSVERAVPSFHQLSLNVDLRCPSCGGTVVDVTGAEIFPPSNAPSILCSSKMEHWTWYLFLLLLFILYLMECATNDPEGNPVSINT